MLQTTLRFGVALLFAALATTAWAENEKTAIYVMNVDGSGTRKVIDLKDYSEHASPRWSHDGRWIAFDAVPVGGGQRMLFVVKPDGSNFRQVGPGSMPSWSPDDKQFACHIWPGKGGSQVVIQNLDGQGRTELGLGNSPQLSPDGSQLAMTDGKNLILTDMATGEAKSFFASPFFEAFKGLAFSPDGKRLAVVIRREDKARRELLIVDAAGEANGVTSRVAGAMGGFVSFSPDGKQLVYADGNKIFIVDVDGKKAPKVVPNQKGKNRNPDWSPDGKQILFVSDRDVQK